MLLAPDPRLEDLAVEPAQFLPTLFQVVQRWGLTNAEVTRLLGFDSVSTTYQWRLRPPHRISNDKLERVAYVLWIHELLHDLFGAGPASDGWLGRNNDGHLFIGRKPKELLCSGTFRDVVKVYEWLFGQTQGWH